MYLKYLAIFLLVFIALSNGNVIPTVEVLQGPSSRTTLFGPDGSALDSAAPGGTVVTNSHGTGLVAAGPAVLSSGPAIFVNGPAGSIATSHTLAGPAIVPAVAPALAASPVVALRTASIHDGDYISDNTEALYDDGSYKGEH